MEVPTDHFQSIINVIKSSLLTNHNLTFNTSGLPSLSEETLESFDLVDATPLGRVFSQVKPTTFLIEPIPTFSESFEEQILNIVNCRL